MNRSISLQKSDVGVLLAVQLALVAVTVLTYLFTVGGSAAQAAAYGGGVAMVSAFMLGRRVLRAAEVARSRPGQETAVLIFGAVQRFMVVIVLFGLGMGWLDLQPVPLLVGFALAQLGHFLNGALVRVRGDSQLEKLG